jgi:peptide chain release factor 1
MNSRLAAKLDAIAFRLTEIDALLGAPEAAGDMAKFRKLSQERAEIVPAVQAYARYKSLSEEKAEAERLLADPEMRALAEEELACIAAELPRVEAALEEALAPKDPEDAKNALLEIRAGTGGDESALFAGDLFRMYARFAEREGWRVETLSANESDLGGYKEIICRVEGPGAYGKLKYESGAHRVQRVPKTEAQGRIHTSACTVAVLPEADEEEAVALDPSELRIDTFRASGAGGQHINKTDSAVRVTHLPTGLVAECQDGRSQHQNKASALRVLAARLNGQKREARRQKEAATRKSLVGSGDRSERIRTYNFPQGRLTDHRVGLTLHKLADVLDGDLGEVLAALAAADRAEKMAEEAGR